MTQEVRQPAWSSRTSFILAAIGSAVGLGNIWKFPYMVGQNGGSAFVAIYLVMAILIVVPIMVAELILGRLGHRTPVIAMESLVRRISGNRGWIAIGWLGMFIAFVVLSYFNVIAGWTVSFALSSAAGEFQGVSSTQATAIYDGFLSSPWRLISWSGVFMAATIFVVARGVNKGLEKAVTFLMPLLFILLLLLVLYSAATADFAKAWNFLFDVDVSSIHGRVILIALGQAFLSNSVGMAIMMTYGSYAGSYISLPKSALTVVGADTLVSLIAGLAIFPLVFAYGLAPSEGPGLIFVTLPIAFGQMPYGQLVGTSFFVLLAIAALTSTISLLEPAVSYLTQRFGLKRAHVATIAGLAAFLAGLPSLLSFNTLAKFFPLMHFEFFATDTFFDLFDWATNNVLLPISGVMIVAFVGWKLPIDVLRDEFGANRRFQFQTWIAVIKYFAPVALGAIIIFNVYWS